MLWQAFCTHHRATVLRCKQSPKRGEPEKTYQCLPRVKHLTKISQSPPAETLGVMWRIMINTISDGVKSGTEQQGKHSARFLPFNIPLKGNLAWNPWHVWWNSIAPCVQWNSPQALGVQWVCVWVCVRAPVLACGLWTVCESFQVGRRFVFHWGKSTLTISCHVWLPSVVTGARAAATTSNRPVSALSAYETTVARHATLASANHECCSRAGIRRKNAPRVLCSSCFFFLSMFEFFCSLMTESVRRFVAVSGGTFRELKADLFCLLFLWVTDGSINLCEISYLGKHFSFIVKIQ